MVAIKGRKGNRENKDFPPGVDDIEAYSNHVVKFSLAGIHAICEDYRAAASIDMAHDEADRNAGRKIAAPVLALWGAQGRLDAWYDVLAIWRDWAGDVRGRALDCGHYLPEERPDEVLAAFEAFFLE